MENLKTKLVTREKHLDHMVKVVPFIVLCYAIQCFFILRMSLHPISVTSLSILGGLLIMMISLFVTYDLRHKVELREEELVISFLGRTTSLKYTDIIEMSINEPGQSFASLKIQTSYKNTTLYFIDEAEQIMNWIEDHKFIESLAA